MTILRLRLFIVLSVLLGWQMLGWSALPNVVLILADDLGYGDLGCYNPAGKIATPHCDRLASQGVRYIDAHTPSSVCTPTRYGLLTGRYCWRSELKQGVLDGFDAPLIEPGRPTIASFLRQQGYATACVGKWHLGLGWQTTTGEKIPRRSQGGFRANPNVDFSKPITAGPWDVGFDSYFGISASLDMSPYCFIDERHARPLPTEESPQARDLLLNQSAGVQAPGFRLDAVLPTLGQKAVAFLKSRAGQSAPFFLYLPLTSPHLPIAPSAEWRGKSAAGTYGDFVMETDAVVGAVLHTLEEINATKQTIVMVTSDNGGLWHSWKPQEADDVAGYKPTDRANYVAERGHHGNGVLRGTKSDIYEGGHRVPFIVRYPAQAPAGRTSDALVVLTDVFATLAEVVGQPLPPTAAEDGFSFVRSWGADPQPTPRTHAIHHTGNGVFGLRDGEWKYVPSRGSGGFSVPKVIKPKDNEPVGQLYHLKTDPLETRNVWQDRPEIVKQMKQRLADIQASSRTRSP